MSYIVDTGLIYSGTAKVIGLPIENLGNFLN